MAMNNQLRPGAALNQLLLQLSRRTPRATYRLQLNADFPLDTAAALSPYLAELGISDLYASPLLMARTGSRHGYDITDHNQISPELGGQQAFTHLSRTLQAYGLGLLLDVVPNHMGIGDRRNGWWLDLLENGPSSIYAHYFDVDWDPVPGHLHNKVLIPVLGGQYGDLLEAGELQLDYQHGAFLLRYGNQTFPISPHSYRLILEQRLDDLIQQLGADHPTVTELQSITTALSYLPSYGERAIERIQERNREKEVIKRRIHHLYLQSPPLQELIATTLATFNATPGDPRSFDALDALLADQPYRLAFWRVAAEEINYRRFFDINELAAIRVELPDVLQATHQLIFNLLATGQAHGLRIDHPDGLWNPHSYFRQLQESYLSYWAAANLPDDAAMLPETLTAQAQAWIAHELREPSPPGPLPRWPLYVVAEKILAADEQLPEDWAIEGTTGYDFLNELNDIFVDQSGRRTLDRIYSDVVGPRPTFANLTHSKKKEIMLVSLASEINTLSHLLDRLAESNRHYRDFTLNSLTFAIREVIASLSIYRTYITGPGSVTPRDEQFIEAAIHDAKRRNPRTAEQIFNFLRDTLLLRNLTSFATELQDEVIHFVMKFQQLTGPVMAKGVEDTSFYVYNRLISLNEVGGHPEQFGGSVAWFHERAALRARRWPHAMLTTSTHDTKRSEDVRARINLLSELPQEWRRMVSLWGRLNTRKRTKLEGLVMPSRNDEYFLYQTLVGAWPGAVADLDAFCERIVHYMEKATREAKVATSWINPNQDYDHAVRSFVEGILDRRRSSRFLDSLATFAERIAYFGRFNSLAQTLIKLTAPGVPDIYQGCELWDFSLVDPDNRRPVDFAHRAQLLAELAARAHDRTALARELLAQAEDGRIKLYLTQRTLTLRREQPTLFAGAAYLPLSGRGEESAHVVAFARRGGGLEALVVVPRLCISLAGGEQHPPLGPLWGETWLPLPHVSPGDRYTNWLTGTNLSVGLIEGTPGIYLRDLLTDFPVALLVA